MTHEEWRESVDAVRYPHMGWWGDGFTSPSFVFGFDADGDTEIRMLGGALFDARTKRALVNSFSYDSHTNLARVVFTTHMFHQGAVELVVDLAVGKPERIEVEAQQGAVANFSNLSVKLAGVETNHAHSAMISFGPNAAPPETLTTSLSTSTSGFSRPAFVFAYWPYLARQAPVAFEFIPPEGRWYPGGGSIALHGLYRIHGLGTTNLADVAKVRITSYPERIRLWLRLPELPGLPESNRSLMNLYHARIPYAKFTSAGMLENALAGYAQAGARAVKVEGLPPGEFPLVYTNTTPTKIIRDIRHRGAAVRGL